MGGFQHSTIPSFHVAYQRRRPQKTLYFEQVVEIPRCLINETDRSDLIDRLAALIE